MNSLSASSKPGVFSIFWIGACLAFLTLTSCVQAASDKATLTRVETGAQAPDFSLKDINGKPVKLSDWRGKLVVLEWFNDGCPFVKKHYGSGNMQALQKEFTGKGVVWLSICSSSEGKQGNHSADEHKQIQKNLSAAPTHLLLDKGGKVGRMYGARTTPDIFILDKQGVIVYNGAIDDQPDTDQASIKSARNHLRSALNEIMDGKKVTIGASKPYGCSVKYAN